MYDNKYFKRNQIETVVLGAIIAGIMCLVSLCSKAQTDTALTYERIIRADSLSKTEIFAKTLVWCSKSFHDSKSAINVKENQSGIIAGKAYFQSIYKIPDKKDSITGSTFTNYYFDWVIEVKDQKLKFSASNIFIQLPNNNTIESYPVTDSEDPPLKIVFRSSSRNQRDWKWAKTYLLKNLDNILNSLNNELNNKSDF